MNKQLTDSERAKLHQGILQALNSMPAQLRRIFVLSRYQSLSPEELARLMNLKPEQTSILLQSAHQSFSHHLRSLVSTLPVETSSEADVYCDCA